jgi:predicted ferric reductase
MKEAEQGVTKRVAEKVRLKYSAGLAARWLGIYVVLAALPALVAWVGYDGVHRGTLIEFAVIIGAIGLAMMALQSLFGGRFRWVAPTFGMDNILQFHKEIGIVATIMVLAHPVMLIAADTQYLSFFDPRVNFPRAIALIFAVIAVPAITLTSIWREWFKLDYERWRLLHGFLGLAIVFVGVVHSLQVSRYFDPLWKKIFLLLFIGACMYLVIHSRITRPWKSRRLPWKVDRVTRERGDAWTLHLTPPEGKKFDFIAGQFIWITLGDSPFSLQQHPFSISSSARSKELSITAKELGDFTGTWGGIPHGTTAFIEGPFGSFTPIPGADVFLIMGGIGVTPAMSILRTMRDDRDPRKAVLLYASGDPEGITFREELDALAAEIDLRIVHVLDELPDGWPGLEGRIDKELLERYLPADRNGSTYYICGPGALMDSAEEALRELGVSWRNIYTERFEVV